MKTQNAERSRYSPKFPARKRNALMLEARRKARKHKRTEVEDVTDTDQNLPRHRHD